MIEAVCKRLGDRVGVDIDERLQARSRKRKFLIRSIPDIKVYTVAPLPLPLLLFLIFPLSLSLSPSLSSSSPSLSSLSLSLSLSLSVPLPSLLFLVLPISVPLPPLPYPPPVSLPIAFQAFPTKFQDFDVQHDYILGATMETQTRIRKRGQRGKLQFWPPPPYPTGCLTGRGSSGSGHLPLPPYWVADWAPPPPPYWVPDWAGQFWFWAPPPPPYWVADWGQVILTR